MLGDTVFHSPTIRVPGSAHGPAWGTLWHPWSQSSRDTSTMGPAHPPNEPCRTTQQTHCFLVDPQAPWPTVSTSLTVHAVSRARTRKHVLLGSQQ